MMQEPNPVVVQAGDKVLLCLAEEPTDQLLDFLSSWVTTHLEGVDVAIVGGVTAVVVQRAGDGA